MERYVLKFSMFVVVTLREYSHSNIMTHTLCLLSPKWREHAISLHQYPSLALQVWMKPLSTQEQHGKWSADWLSKALCSLQQ